MLRQCLSPSRGFGKAREDLKSWWSFSKTVRLRRCVKGISKGLESKIVSLWNAPTLKIPFISTFVSTRKLLTFI